MRFLANENFPMSSVQELKNAGIDVLSIGTDFQGITDEEVMNFAIAENRTILTFDKDYGELVFRDGFRPQAGVIFLRLFDFNILEPAEIILGLIQSETIDFERKLTVISKQNIRQRGY